MYCLWILLPLVFSVSILEDQGPEERKLVSGTVSSGHDCTDLTRPAQAHTSQHTSIAGDRSQECSFLAEESLLVVVGS